MRYANTLKGKQSQRRRDYTYRTKNFATEHTPKVEESSVAPDPVIAAGSCARCGGEIVRVILIGQLAVRSLRRIFDVTARDTS